jgi:peroxiredoxin
MSQRQSFLIKDGKVIWHQPKANPMTQTDDAIAALKAHG